MRTIIWKLGAGTQDGQESAEQKRQAGYDYIEMISKDEHVLTVAEEDNCLKIYLED